ncbi:YafY family protein [Granulicella sp. L60]|uniref:helix-turn-helix transcriptional regulator n=1 Tax=Granulicella sp. L60 TaxID=1641866 RepID=UPI00131E7C6C|nr:WYL domain-containing protein [Granulicella sp. L60]
MKSDRLLSALLLLQAKGRVTSRELSERLEVSQRTVHRDMEALSAAKVPISALRGSQGGWQLERDWRTHVPGLDEAELRALLMTQPRALSDPAMAAAAERAFGKLMAALPGPMREQAAAMSERLHVDPTGWHATTEDLSMLPIVQDAVARDCKLTFDYTRADGQTAPRTVDPLGIVAKGVSWYLVARAPHGIRTYRISRMHAVTALATTFERPPNFKLSTHWKLSTTQLQEQRKHFDAVVALTSQAAHMMRGWCATSPLRDEQTYPLQKEWIALNIRFEDEDQARFLILGFGSRAQVLAPPLLRERIAAEANAILTASEQTSHYTGTPAPPPPRSAE